MLKLGAVSCPRLVLLLVGNPKLQTPLRQLELLLDQGWWANCDPHFGIVVVRTSERSHTMQRRRSRVCSHSWPVWIRVQVVEGSDDSRAYVHK